MLAVKIEMNIGDILIAKEPTNEEIKTIISSICSCDDLIVINDLEECLKLPKKSNWIVLYSKGTGRFPCHISPDGFNIHPSTRFELAKLLGVEIAWSSDSEPNPFKWIVVYPNGLEKTEFLEEEDINR